MTTSYRIMSKKLSTVTVLCGQHQMRKESSVNIKIFIGLKDLHAELTGLTMLDFFLSFTSVTRFGVTLKKKGGFLVFTFSQI